MVYLPPPWPVVPLAAKMPRVVTPVPGPAPQPNQRRVDTPPGFRRARQADPRLAGRPPREGWRERTAAYAAGLPQPDRPRASATAVRGAAIAREMIARREHARLAKT
jgi:hypothetical protein